MKIPEPIITPTTTITESKSPSPRANVGSCEAAAGELEEVRGALLVINILVILGVLLSRVKLLVRAGRPSARAVSRRLVSLWRREACEKRLVGA
jgi:hypothetical protein